MAGNVGHYAYFTFVVQTITAPHGSKLHIELSVLLSVGLAHTVTDLREVRLCRSCIRLNCDNTEERKYFYMDYVLKCTSTKIDWKSENHSYECASLSAGKEIAFLIKREGSLPWSQGGPPLDPQTEPDTFSPHPYTLCL